MYQKIKIYSLCFILLCGCSGSPIRTGAVAEENKYKMAFIKKGMTEEQVRWVMGKPYDIENYIIDGESFEVWFYITRRVGLAQSRMLPKNFTPLIFQDGVLLGWGFAFYNHLLDIEHARDKRESEIRQRYTDDDEEWPAIEHQWILPPEEPAEGAQEPLPLNEPYIEEEEIEVFPEDTRPGRQERQSKRFFQKK